MEPNPFFLQFHHPENYQERPQRSRFFSGPLNIDDQELSLAFSSFNLSCPPPFELPAGHLMGNYWCPLREQEGMNMNNVHLMRAQNGVLNFDGSFVGPTSGPHRDFLVGPVPCVDILGGGNGGGVNLGGSSYGVHPRLNFDDVGGVDFAGTSYGVPQRLDFYDVGQRSNVYCQSGQSYGTNTYDSLLQSKNLTSGNENGNGGGGVVNGYGVDFAGSSYGVPKRLSFDDVGQRDNVYCQSGQYYGTNISDPLSHSKKVTLGNQNVSYPRMPQNVCLHEGLMDNLVTRNSNYIMHPCDDFSIKDFKGMIVLFAQDQSLSKFLQKKIEGQSFQDNEFVVAEVIDYVYDLMKNQFGGYFIQKLFGVCNEDQRTRIIVAATRMSSELVNVCLCSHGAKTVQILMENLNTPQQISLVISALCPGAVVLCSDPHGQHVIRCCLTNYSYEFNKLLLEKIVQNCFQIATNKCGCCVLQSCVEYSHGEPRERLIDEIIANAVLLAQDPYGNYVVQLLVGLRIPEITADLIQHLRGKFTSLSCNKFASNVVEKFLLEADEKYATTIIEDLLENPQAASMLLINPYGNFVIQTALTVSKGEVFKKLFDLILENAPSITNNVYAEKIFAWFDKKNISLGKYMNN